MEVHEIQTSSIRLKMLSPLVSRAGQDNAEISTHRSQYWRRYATFNVIIFSREVVRVPPLNRVPNVNVNVSALAVARSACVAFARLRCRRSPCTGLLDG